ncbi:hypothetical protein, partial [Bacteroides thetaiotaomicron]|uniref:hypothetical protein n=1 Tax=Bacteroides thetaiotaomicron TaxID=818 RepID=UPI00403FD77E
HKGNLKIFFEQSEKSKNCPTRTLLAIYTHAAWEYIHANRPAKSPGVLENPHSLTNSTPFLPKGITRRRSHPGTCLPVRPNQWFLLRTPPPIQCFSFPLIAHEYISAAAREENTSCIGSPFSNQ